jgi:hypothetical protein
VASQFFVPLNYLSLRPRGLRGYPVVAVFSPVASGKAKPTGDASADWLMHRPLGFVSPIMTSAAWPALDAAEAPDVAATAVVAGRAFALVVGFVVGAVSPPAVSLCR